MNFAIDSFLFPPFFAVVLTGFSAFAGATFLAAGFALVTGLDFDDFILFNVYFPNGGSGPDKLAYKFDFFDEFFKILYVLRDQGFNIIVTGDVNIAHTELDR